MEDSLNISRNLIHTVCKDKDVVEVEHVVDVKLQVLTGRIGPSDVRASASRRACVAMKTADVRWKERSGYTESSVVLFNKTT